MDLYLYVIGLFCVAGVRCADNTCAENNPADIVFVLDESGSIWGPDFHRQIEFVKAMLQSFDVQKDATHAGVMTFSDQISVHFNLGEIYDLATIEVALDHIEQQRGETYTYDAIEEMYDEMFSSAHARAGVPHICILITDGESANTDETALQAHLARESGVVMFAIGVGQNINLDELHSIASKPESSYTHTVYNYEALDPLKELLAWQVCQVATTTTTTTTTTTVPTTTPPQMIEGCDGGIMVDLLFAIPDQAGIEGTADCLDFIDAVIGETELGPIQVQVGVTPRNCEPAPAIKLNQHDTKDGFSMQLGTRKYPTSRTDQHIYYMRTQGLNSRNGARPDSVKMGLLIVDNASFNSNRAIREAAKAKSDPYNMQLVVIGVGDRVDKTELQQISSGSGSFFWVEDYADLETKKDDVIKRLCEGIMRDFEYRRRSLYEYILRDLINYRE